MAFPISPQERGPAPALCVEAGPLGQAPLLDAAGMTDCALSIFIDSTPSRLVGIGSIQGTRPVGIRDSPVGDLPLLLRCDSSNDFERKRLVSVRRPPAVEATLAAIAAHPTRIQAFIYLSEREGSSSEIAEALGEETNYVANHVNKLLEIGAIELVAERIVGNRVKKVYRAMVPGFSGTEEFEQMSKPQREVVTMSILRFIVADFAASVGAGTFDSRPDRSLLRLPGWVDDEGYRRISKLHDQTLFETEEIVGEAASRIAKDPDSAIPFTSITMLFERALPKRTR
jgi:hypothetical protein